MKFSTTAILAASASVVTAIPKPFMNVTADGPDGCSPCKPFAITVARGNSDPSKALSRNAILTNGNMPGPALHMKVGECVDFKVTNNLGEDTTVHFHGIRQLLTPWSDGTPGISQKAISTGNTYTYRWVADEVGVYFYHSHYKSQMMDGMYGAIVIAAADGTAKPYTSLGDAAALEAAEAKVETVLASDWNQFTAAEFFNIQKQANIDDACTDAIILNGYGSTYCYSAEELTANERPQVPFILGNSTLTAKGCIPASNALIQGNYTRNLKALPPGAYDECKAYKAQNYTYEVDSSDQWAAMSFISPSGFTLFVATIDSHKLYVYELNGQYIEPQIVDQIAVTPGDRVSFFVKLDQTPGDYTIRVANDGINQVISGFGTLRYKNGGGKPEGTAIMNIGGVSPRNQTVVLLDNAHAVPFAAPLVGAQADKTFLLDVMKDPGSKEAWQWVLNGVEPYSQSNDDDQVPFLYEGPAGVPQSDLVLRTNYNDWVDLIIKVAGPLAQPHPIHKHANKFHVIGSGVGDFTYSSVAEAQKAGVSFNLVNPPYLDGFTSTPAEGNSTWMVFRYQANTPGAWFLHCHIQTHLSGGMAVAILDGVDKWPTLPKNPGSPSGDFCYGNGTDNGNHGHGGHGNSTTTTSSSPSTTSIWGGWEDVTSPPAGATSIPNGPTGGSPAIPTGVNGGDGNYGGADWTSWSSINAKASSVSGLGGFLSWTDASTPQATSTATGTWSSWTDGSNASPAATSAAASWSSWTDGNASPAATSTAAAAWSSWTDGNGASPAATSAAASWSSWAAGSGASGVAAASGTWSSWAAGSSATGVAAYSGAGVPGGIATYQGAASSIKAGSMVAGAFVVGAVALLL